VRDETLEPEPRRAGRKIRKGERKWLLRTFVGRDAQGRRHYRSETFLGSSKDAETKLRKMLEGKSAHDARVFLNDYLDTWLAGQLEIGKRTLSDYTALLQAYVRPVLGLLRLSDIRSTDVRKLYKGLLDRDLSPRTVRYVHTVLSKALKECEALDANPCSKVKLPKQRPRKPQFLMAAQAKQLLEAARSDRLYALFAVAVDSGMRPSEQLGLRWQDVNLESGLISVQHGLKWFRKGGGYELGSLKTTRSQRCIELHASTLQILAKHRIAQHQERLAPARPSELRCTHATLTAATLNRFSPGPDYQTFAGTICDTQWRVCCSRKALIQRSSRSAWAIAWRSL
jgi:integrase